MNLDKQENVDNGTNILSKTENLFNYKINLVLSVKSLL
jgi:hypothetical protein